MDNWIDRLKDKGSTIPGVIITIMGLIGIFREYAVQLIDAVNNLGYAWAPNPITIALGMLTVIGLKMIFLDGKKKE